MERITSSQNPLLRHIRKLQSSASYRRQWGEFVADGFKLLEEALRLYQGRALYEGSLSEEELLPMCRKYGLII